MRNVIFFIHVYWFIIMYYIFQWNLVHSIKFTVFSRSQRKWVKRSTSMYMYAAFKLFMSFDWMLMCVHVSACFDNLVCMCVWNPDHKDHISGIIQWNLVMKRSDITKSSYSTAQWKRLGYLFGNLVATNLAFWESITCNWLQLNSQLNSPISWSIFHWALLYNKVILLVPALYISSSFFPDIMRNLILQGNFYGPKDLVIKKFHCTLSMLGVGN